MTPLDSRTPFVGKQVDLIARREGLKERLASKGFDAALISYHRDVLYYTGTAQPANLLVFSGRDPILFVRRAFDLASEDTGGGLELVHAPSFAAVQEALSSLEGPGHRLGVALDVMPAGHLRRLESMLPDWMVDNVSPLVLAQRAIKQPCEIEALEHAAALSSIAYETIIGSLTPGISPVELAAEVGRALRRRGVEENVFFRRWDAWLPSSGIFAAGDEAAIISGHAMTVTGTGVSQALPWGPSRRPIGRGEVVYVDIGLNLAGYHTDFTRSYVAGRADSQASELFDIVKRAQEAAIGALQPGAPANATMRAAQEVVASAGVAGNFQGYGDKQGDYVGHGVGLELDERPTLTSKEEWPLEVNMCLAVETKLIMPEWGGIGIEDTLILEDHGPRLLTRLPRELIEVE